VARVGTINCPEKVPPVTVAIGATRLTGPVAPIDTMMFAPAVLLKPLPVIVTIVPEGPEAGDIVMVAETVKAAVAMFGVGSDWSVALTLYAP
jgi:hypothetical protein